MTTATGTIPQRAYDYLAANGNAGTVAQMAAALNVGYGSLTSALNRKKWRGTFCNEPDPHNTGRHHPVRIWHIADGAPRPEDSKFHPVDKQQPSSSSHKRTPGKRTEPAKRIPRQNIVLSTHKQADTYWAPDDEPAAYTEPTERFIRVSPGEKTCRACGETCRGGRCVRCRGTDLVSTTDYLQPDEWRLVR